MDEEILHEHDCDENVVYYEFIEDGHRYHGYECGVCGKLLQTGQEIQNGILCICCSDCISCYQSINYINVGVFKMNDDDVKQQALEQAQQAYGLFIWFVKWFSYVMIFMIVLMFMNNWFDDGTGSMFMPDEIYEDQYDPKGLNKKKGI